MKLCIYEVETSLNWGALTVGVFSNTYILNFDQTNWLFPCRRASGELPYLKCPLHTVLKLTPVAYGQPLCSTFISSPLYVLIRLQILFDCVCFSSLLSQVVKWSLSSSTSKLSTRTETNQRWVMFYFYYVVSAELPVEPSSQRMNVENDQQINPEWKYYNSSVTLSYIFLIILTNLHLLYVTFSLSDLFYLYFCASLEVLLIWVLPPSLVTTPDWSGVP